MLPTNTPSNSDSSNSFNTKHIVSTSDNSSNNITSSSNINNPKITIVNKYAYVVNCDNSLVIFKSPCDISDILISVSGNKKVYVYNKLPNGWACVEYHGVKGYMIVAELIFL